MDAVNGSGVSIFKFYFPFFSSPSHHLVYHFHSHGDFFKRKAINICVLVELASEMQTKYLCVSVSFATKSSSSNQCEINTSERVYRSLLHMYQKAPFSFLHRGWATTHIIKTTRKSKNLNVYGEKFETHNLEMKIMKISVSFSRQDSRKKVQ